MLEDQLEHYTPNITHVNVYLCVCVTVPHHSLTFVCDCRSSSESQEEAVREHSIPHSLSYKTTGHASVVVCVGVCVLMGMIPEEHYQGACECLCVCVCV